LIYSWIILILIIINDRHI